MLHQYLRGIAGIVVLTSLTLGLIISPNFFYLTGFVGLNLLQSSFTNWCPMMTFLRMAGVPETCTTEKKIDEKN